MEIMIRLDEGDGPKLWKISNLWMPKPMSS